jgi:hypothetical protein
LLKEVVAADVDSACIAHDHPARPQDERGEPLGLAHPARAKALDRQHEHLLDEVVRLRTVPEVTETVRANHLTEAPTQLCFRPGVPDPSGVLAIRDCIVFRHAGGERGMPLQSPQGPVTLGALATLPVMKYLCLAYGDDKDWKLLSRSEKDARLAADEVLRKRGDVVVSVETTVTTVRAWDGTPTTTAGAFANAPTKLAGFYIIEATDLHEAVKLVAATPCPRTGGAIEVRPLASNTTSEPA